MDKAYLRKQYIQARKALTPENRTQQEQAVYQQLIAMSIYQQAKTIAIYLAMPGEFDPLLIMQHAHQNNKQLVVPIVQNKEKRIMHFFPLVYKNDAWVTQEDQPACDLSTCDLMLIPLVAFDQHNYRLGMGGGFYDTTLAELNKQPSRIKHQKPCFLGLAYREQLAAASLSSDSWDVPLDATLAYSSAD